MIKFDIEIKCLRRKLKKIQYNYKNDIKRINRKQKNKD
jgi:hypothetical protein